MEDLERRLQNLERQKRQRGKQRPRRRTRRSSSTDWNKEQESLHEHDRHNQGMHATRSTVNPHSYGAAPSPPQSTGPEHQSPRLDMSLPPSTHQQEGNSQSPVTSSPVPRGPPVPPFRVSDLGDLDATDITQSSEPTSPTSSSFLDNTVLPNPYR